MAIIDSIILGRAKGSIGNVTLSTQQGRVIAKQKASIVGNPRTARQVSQRNKLAKAVMAWQFIGTLVKSGITSLIPFGYEYQTYTSKNMNIFQDRAFNGKRPTGEDIKDSYATIGKFGEVNFNPVNTYNDKVQILVPGDTLSTFAKVGDKIKVVSICMDSSLYASGQITITADMLLPGVHNVMVPVPGEGDLDPAINAVWFETADGKDSTTSVFK